MPTTEWELRRALADRVRGMWDAMRTADPSGWQTLYEYAREDCAQRMERQAAVLRGVTWEEFQRLQGIQGSER